MQEIRCGNCSKKLGEGEYHLLNIKCPRCKVLNQLRATSFYQERPGALSGVQSNDQTHHSLAGR